MSLLGDRASDIDVTIADFCLILGYLSTPGRVGLEPVDTILAT